MTLHFVTEVFIHVYDHLTAIFFEIIIDSNQFLSDAILTEIERHKISRINLITGLLNWTAL